MYGCKSWTTNKAEHQRIDTFKLWCWRRLLRLDCKEIKPVNPKGNQPWIFTERNVAETEAPILWPPDVESWLIAKTLMLEKIESKRRRGRQRMRWLDHIYIYIYDTIWHPDGTSFQSKIFHIPFCELPFIRIFIRIFFFYTVLTGICRNIICLQCCCCCWSTAFLDCSLFCLTAPPLFPTILGFECSPFLCSSFEVSRFVQCL